MSALEEVDVEEQLQNQDDSDTPVIKINTEVSDEKKEPKFEVGDIVADTVNFDPQGPIPPVYVVKEIREGGKYLIEQQNLEDDEIPSPYEVGEDDLTPVNPKSPSGSSDTPESLKKKPKFKVGELVIDMVNFKPVDAANKEVQPIYIVKAITEDGKYLIEQHNVEEGQEVSPAYEIDEDDLTPVNPPSPDFAPESKFELSTEQKEMVEQGIKDEAEDEKNENLTEITSDETDSEDDDSDDEDDFKKLENDISRDYLLSYHPELKQINFNELIALSKITRNKQGVIIDPLHKTFPYLTKFERAKILGQRAKQINNGSPIFVKVTPNIIEGHTIALMELQQKKIPFIIKRPLPNGSNEYWKVSDLNILD